MKSLILIKFIFIISTSYIYGQWQVELSQATDVKNPVNYPHFAWYPDGHISVVPDGEEYIMFWAEFESHRSIGSSQFVEDQTALSPENAVFGRRGNFDTYDNGGSWMMSVFRQEGEKFIGFFHAEDHWYPHTTNNIAWKSLGVAYSEDKGVTWSNAQQTITSSKPKPATPEWGGTGDCCVVWDHLNKRWMCYFQEHILSMAISTDPNGAPGTWKKYYQGDFSEEGLGGQQTVLPGLSQYPGGNPSVHWNTYLSKWVMVWHGWSPPRIYVAVSDDGVSWDNPQSIIVSEEGGNAWYPTIIGVTDIEAGQIAKIYYADFGPNMSYRKFRARTITFLDPNNTKNTTAQIDTPANGSTISINKVDIKTSIENVKAAIEKVEFFAGDKLIGSDTSFPYEMNWSPNLNGNYSIKAIYTDTEGTKIETNAVNISVDYVITGMNDLRQRGDFSIYPCPGSEKVILAGLPSGYKKISIYNAAQNKVYEESSASSQVEINVIHYADGVYFVNVLCDNEVFNRPFIKN
jgi:hypothetical protein